MKKKLNLGSGDKILPGYINMDKYQKNADVNHDANVFPYPFPDNYFDEILISHTLEHLIDPYAVHVECERIAKDKCVFDVRLPSDGRWVLGHLRTKHPTSYLNTLFSVDKRHPERDYRRNSFIKIKFEKRRMRRKEFGLLHVIKRYLYMFYEWRNAQKYLEYRWVYVFNKKEK